MMGYKAEVTHIDSPWCSWSLFLMKVIHKHGLKKNTLQKAYDEK